MSHQSAGRLINIPGGGNQPSRPRKRPHQPDRGQIAKYQIPTDYMHTLATAFSIMTEGQLVFDCDGKNLRDLSTSVKSDLLSERHIENIGYNVV